MNYDTKVIYDNLRAAGATPAQKLGWSNKDLQQQNFQLLTEMVERQGAVLPGLVVHDAGCGTGDLLEYLIETNREPRGYIGTDTNEVSLAIAREHFPKRSFYTAAMESLPVAADVTMCVGSLAYHKPRAVEMALEFLWANTSCVLAFNTWWELDSNYVYHEHIEQLRKCIRRFLRLKYFVERPGDTYGQPTERLFVVYH